MTASPPGPPDADAAVLASSFGGVASHYERFRPGPSVEAVAWYLPHRVARVVDLGAGTGALARLLVGRSDEVVAVEPDDRMRSVLAAAVPGVSARAGSGESMPVDDASADAVIASTSWHWMDPVATVDEAARVLVPGGYLGALWTGADPDGPFLAGARDRLAASGAGEPGSGDSELAGLADRTLGQDDHALVIPDGAPFDSPERATFTWDIALDADELVGLLDTFSWVITMPGGRRTALFAQAREMLASLGIEGSATVDITWRTDAYRARRNRIEPPG